MKSESKTVPVRELDRFTLRVADETLAAIDALCAVRPGNVSRNTWITEAVQEKLLRDTTKSLVPDNDRSAHG
ncbi:hypothetical protein [Hansschlegelia sp. KR7-227]|uniref:Ribbon-helix-helix protein, CopG family n=1 Tax=Hansschlegelia zhihuaiae TaxID=405005 RepID=A0A4Q0ME68_9HYPH|nr:hypothetical protein EK403_15805 [Hansschlegelia zhihuaiae]